MATKSTSAKQGLTIPRLELVSAHMASNLVGNVQTALEGFPVIAMQGWLDSTVALHWINVTNRMGRSSSTLSLNGRNP